MALATLATIAASVLPSIIGYFDDNAGKAAEKVGRVVQGVVGVDDPTEAARLIQADPALAARLRERLMDLQIEMERERTKRIERVNETMQAETQAKHWWSSAWRPFWGFCSALAFLAVAGLCCWLAYQAILEGKPEALAMIPQLITAFAALFAIPGAILGVASWHRGVEKRIRAGGR
jgi:hypothetical protein